MFETTQKQPVAIYCRVSTTDQQDRGTIESQIEFARKYCELHEIEIYNIFKDDGTTGTLPLQERPAGSELMQAAKDKLFDTILVYKLDRLGRATRVILNAIYELEKLGVKLKSMTEPFDTGDASGRFLLTILAGVADLERSNILERMWLGANRSARDGIWLGGIVPYGYFKNDEKYLEINNHTMPSCDVSEADVIRLIYKLTTDDKMTTIKIADYLNALRIPPSYVIDSPATGRRKKETAGIWRPGRILNMLKSTTYKGLHQYGKRSKKKRDIIERPVPALVSPEDWETAQKVIRSHYVLSRRNAKRTYLLTGLIKCGNCGYTYQSTCSKGSTYYQCGGRSMWRAKGTNKCYGRSITMSWLDNYVWNDCLRYIHNPDEAIEEIQANQKRHLEPVTIKEEQLLIKSQLNQKETEKGNILDLYRKNLISMQDVELQLQKIADEKLALEDHLKRLTDDSKKDEDIFATQASARALLNELQNKINSTENTVEFKREIIMSIVEKIAVYTIDQSNPRSKMKITIHYKFHKTSDGFMHNTAQVDNHTDRDSLMQS
jgi:site-specific DNA recombinase